MNTTRIKIATKVWIPILALGLILLPSAATAENGTGSGASAEQGLAASLIGFFQPVANWFLSVTGLAGGEPQSGAGNGTGEPQSGAGNGTGEPQSSAGSGTGLVSQTGQGSDKDTGNGTGR